ncbi:NU205-like protein [Mya arenaria]|uniref:NU205-like protein n=1 Tax=Mya arenaria TaxID=6604 RepID=A0ABY7EGZ1_MYAAR|nr:NU205-like protein [Mya arenaria]
MSNNWDSDAVGVGGSPSMDRIGGGDSVSSFDLDDSRRHVRQQDIDTLKQAAVTVLSESLFKKIQEINQTFCKSRSHYGFVEAVIRRVKRLLRLHTVLEVTWEMNMSVLVTREKNMSVFEVTWEMNMSVLVTREKNMSVFEVTWEMNMSVLVTREKNMSVFEVTWEMNMSVLVNWEKNMSVFEVTWEMNMSVLVNWEKNMSLLEVT